MDSQKIKEDYIEHLKPSYYNKEMNVVLQMEPEATEFVLSTLHDITQSRIFKGNKLLEIGSGSTIHCLASLSVQFTNIVQSDLVEENLEELRKWHQGDSSLDWTGQLNLVAQLHGYEKNLEEGRKFLEQRIKQSVKRIVKCDVLTDEVIPRKELTDPQVSPPYDLIVTSFCLDASAPDVEEFTRMLKRLNALLKVGGGLLIFGLESATFWKTGKKKFHQLQITRDQYQDCLTSAGFKIVETKTHNKGKSKYQVDWKTIFFAAAEKI